MDMLKKTKEQLKQEAKPDKKEEEISRPLQSFMRDSADKIFEKFIDEDDDDLEDEDEDDEDIR